MNKFYLSFWAALLIMVIIPAMTPGIAWAGPLSSGGGLIDFHLRVVCDGEMQGTQVEFTVVEMAGTKEFGHLFAVPHDGKETSALPAPAALIPALGLPCESSTRGWMCGSERIQVHLVQKDGRLTGAIYQVAQPNDVTSEVGTLTSCGLGGRPDSKVESTF